MQTHTGYSTQIDKNRHNRMLCSSVGGRTTGLQTLPLTLFFPNP